MALIVLMTAPLMMVLSRRNKILFTSSHINTSLNLVMWVKMHQERLKPSVRVARCESNFNPAGDQFTMVESLSASADVVLEDYATETQQGLPILS